MLMQTLSMAPFPIDFLRFYCAFNFYSFEMLKLLLFFSIPYYEVILLTAKVNARMFHFR